VLPSARSAAIDSSGVSDGVLAEVPGGSAAAGRGPPGRETRRYGRCS
jgi:hypothetical protein